MYLKHLSMENEKFKKYMEELNSYEKDFIRFNKENDFVLSDPKEDGLYLTIRCGHGGIYQVINEWKDCRWMVYTADGSKTIARSRDKIVLKNLPCN
jgi:hypothetical protein